MSERLPSMPNHLTKALVAGAGVALALVVSGCSDAESASEPAVSSPPAAMETTASPTDPTAQPVAASNGWITWEDYQRDKASYADSDVVLFFNASWCPTCQNTVKSLDAAKADFPDGLTVVSVDYDTATDLKKQYGVTTQHTFVQIQPDGSEVQKWTGTETVDAIQAKV